MKRILLSFVLLAAFAGAEVSALEYRGLCEASAGAFIDNTHFAVASDETNVLQIYERGNPTPIGNGVDLQNFTSFDKSDLEAAAVVGDRVYWISSHSFNSQGEDKPKRKIFFATRIVSANGKPRLEGVGRPVKSLRNPIATAAGVEPRDLNIEGLAATPDGGLLIGLRAPLRKENGKERAIIVPLKNPAAVVDGGAAPDVGSPVTINLGGRGIRSIDQLGKSGSADYIIVAGPVADAEGFALFRWAGPGKEPVEISGVNLKGLTLEGAMLVPGQNVVQLLSDDGSLCSDEDDPIDKRKFRSIDVSLPN